MFRSRTRSLVIPQHEHARFAADIASHWGNDAFELPALPFSDFVQGVLDHDRGYDPFDTHAIGETPEEEWTNLQLRGLARSSGNVTVDILIAFHIKRLLGHGNKPQRVTALNQVETAIQGMLAVSPYPHEYFQFADLIMHFCDNLSFDFCFDEARLGSALLCPRRDSDHLQALNYSIDSRGFVFIEPWPLAVPVLNGSLTAYETKNYPEKLVAKEIAYTLSAR